MRRWLSAAARAARIAERPATWVPGALAWAAVLGWLPLALAVVPPPTQSALTYFGAGMRTSGAWPLNLFLLVAGTLAIAGIAAVLAAVGNTVLLGRIERRAVEPADAGRVLGAAVIFGLPVVLGAGVMLVAVAAVAPSEFNRSGSSLDPMVRTVMRVAPLLMFTVVVTFGATVLGGMAGRLAIRSRSLAAGLVRTPSQARATRAAGAIHAIVSVVLAIGYLAVATLLVRVLWAPIAVRLTAEETSDPVTMVLLVGFVAIWLCLVLGGGALHAWSTATWSHLDDLETASMNSRAAEAAWKS